MSKDPRDVKEELIQIYPKKLRQKRSEQIVVTEHREDGSVPEIKANVRSSPGIITQRGCTYAGCKGVVIGPSRDILSITHGPIGCSFYSWLTRRNQTRPHTAGTTRTSSPTACPPTCRKKTSSSAARRS